MKIKITKEDLRKEYNFLKSNKYKEVKGVFKIDSGKPGPVFGLTVCTHGNELAGLGAMYYLRNIFKIEDKLKNGSVVFVINNLKSCGKAINSKNINEKNNARYIDFNMNRLPEDLLEIKKSNKYEINRSLDLIPIWSEFDFAMDIHSTFKDSNPMIILTDTTNDEIIKGFPMDTIISNIDKIQIGLPAFAFYGGDKNIPQVEIESGQHEDPKSYEVAIESILNFLSNIDLLDREKKERIKRKMKEYEIVSSVILPSLDYRLVKIFKGFELIKKGQAIATDGSEYITSDNDYHVIMPPPNKKPVKAGEEIMFLSKPVKKKTI